MALPKKHRLLVNKTSLSVFRKEGKSIATPLLSAYYMQGNNRFGVVVSSHISKKAVIRNHIRRLIHGVIVANMPSKAKVDMIIFPKRAMADLKNEDVRKEIEQLLKKLS